MISLDEARQFVLDRCTVNVPVEVPLALALGRVCADDLYALESVPPFVNSAVDGYAVIAADTISVPVDLVVVDTVAAGAARFDTQVSGEAVRIMTGAPMPPGADAVVMVEDTERLEDGRSVRIGRAVATGDALRHVGDDVTEGELLFARGTVLNAAALGVLASVNHRTVRVHPRLRVAVLSTGDELIDTGEALLPGQIRESNKSMLVGCLAQAGCDVVDYGVVRDDEAALAATLRAAAETCDAIVTSGGVSMGDYDVVKAVLSQIAEMRWMQIAIKPAKPFAFGLLQGTPVFGLPGNPVSSLVSFELLARPALRQMMGHGQIDRVLVRAVADGALRRGTDGKTHYTRVVGGFGDDGRWHVQSTGAQGSHQLAATAAANGLAIVPDGGGIAAGADVMVWILDIG